MSTETEFPITSNIYIFFVGKYFRATLLSFTAPFSRTRLLLKLWNDCTECMYLCRGDDADHCSFWPSAQCTDHTAILRICHDLCIEHTAFLRTCHAQCTEHTAILRTCHVSFRTRLTHVAIVVDELALPQIFVEYFGFSCQFSIQQLLHKHVQYGAGTEGSPVTW
jgi:hypothetical protein